MEPNTLKKAWGVVKPGLKLNIHLMAFFLVLLMVSFSSALHADHHSGDRLNEIKAAFVLNVARFISWPDKVGSDSTVLCYYRNNPFAEGLDTIEGRTVAGKQLETKLIKELSAANSCQILLIPASELNDFSSRNKPELPTSLLTFADRTHIDSETEVTSRAEGIMVSLVRKGSHIGFDIDLAMTRAAGLKVRAQLLKHARIVDEGS
mgnify:CR=1 FL=1